MDEQPHSSRKLLIVEDDPLQLRLIQKYVANTGFEVLTATSALDAMRIVLSEGPQIVLTDWIMPQMDGLQLCRALREHEGVRFVYVIVFTSNARSEQLMEAFEAGANDFLAKPVDRTELLGRLRAAERIVTLESDLARRTRELHGANAQMALTHQKLNRAVETLRRMATTDELTGLLNRREAINRLKDAWAGRQRYGLDFAVISLDIDRFKHFNDTYGHAAGDAILRALGRVLQKSVRETDKACRIGGEEFLVICPGASLQGAAVCAEHIRATIAAHRFRFEGVTLPVTVSLGVAGPMLGVKSPDELLRVADAALYQSKRDGRNRMTVAGASGAETATVDSGLQS